MHSLTIELRFFSHLAPNVVKNGQRIVCQRVNRSYLFFDEPEPNGSVQLSFNGIFARQNYTLGGTHKFDFREICLDRKSTRLNSSHRCISYAVFCLKKKKENKIKKI